jgi:hypothetical protein
MLCPCLTQDVYVCVCVCLCVCVCVDRVRMAKNLFDVSCGIPVQHPESGQLQAVIMLYRVRRPRMHRMNASWRSLQKHPAFRARLKSAARLGYWALLMQESIDLFEVCREGGKHSGGMGHGVDVALDLDEPSELAVNLSFNSAASEATPPVGTRLRHWCIKYFDKFKGVPGQTPTSGHTISFCLWTMVGTFLSFLLITGLERHLKSMYVYSGAFLGFPQSGNYWPVVLINSMAAVAGMLFAAPTSPLIQPRALVGGHLIATTCAVAVDYLSNPFRGYALMPRWVATPLAPALAILIQAKVPAPTPHLDTRDAALFSFYHAHS